MHFFESEIIRALEAEGYKKVVVKTVYSPAWTTDWLSDETKEKLRQYGIAPPFKTCPAHDFDLSEENPVVPCPRCNSTDTQLKSEFGSTACKALYICQACLEPFEYFKAL